MADKKTIVKLSDELVITLTNALEEYEDGLHKKINGSSNTTPAEDPFYMWTYEKLHKEQENVGEILIKLLKPEDIEEKT